MDDEQSDQIFAMIDVLAERVRKVGHPTLHSIGEVARNQRIADNDASYVTPQDMLAELREDNGMLAKRMREAHSMIDEHNDMATVACWRCSSMKPSGVRGFSTRRAMPRRLRHSGRQRPGLAFRRVRDGRTITLGLLDLRTKSRNWIGTAESALVAERRAEAERGGLPVLNSN